MEPWTGMKRADGLNDMIPEKEFGELFDRHMLQRREEMRERYRRVLPSGELIFNRFDKAKYLNCGEDSSVYDTAVVMGDVSIGAHVWVGPYTILDGSGGRLSIGDWVSVNAGVMIYTHDSTGHYLSGGIMPFEKGDVSIGDHTVIGTMSMIGNGVSIGHHCIIGANSFVKNDIPDFSIVSGTPARITGRVTLEEDGTVTCHYD